MSKPVPISIVARAMTPEKYAELAKRSERAARPHSIEKGFDIAAQEKADQERRDFYEIKGIRRGGSTLRPLMARRNRIFKLTKFAKDFLFLYFNDGLSVDEVIDQMTAYRQRGNYARRYQAIDFAKRFLFAYLNSGEDADAVVAKIIDAQK